MNRLLLAAFLVVFSALCLRAQQEPLYAHALMNRLIVNPAFAGSQPKQVSALYRNQWVGFEGAPKTAAVMYHQPAFKTRVGLGFSLVHHTIGILKSTTLEFSYAYRFGLYNGNLAMGIQLSGRMMSQNWSDKRLIEPSPGIPDPTLPEEIRSKTLINFGPGIYYTVPGIWYVGLSVPRLIPQNIDFDDLAGELSYGQPHINLMGGYTFERSDELKFSANTLVKYVKGAPFDIDINLSGIFSESWFGGATYRIGGDQGGIGESISPQFGFRVKDLFFMASYDISFSRLRRYSKGSPEFSVRWMFGMERISPEVDYKNKIDVLRF